MIPAKTRGNRNLSAGLCLFSAFTVRVWPATDTRQIELLLGTVNDVRVRAPMELYQVAGELWEQCSKLSAMISEMLWHAIKR